MDRDLYITGGSSLYIGGNDVCLEGYVDEFSGLMKAQLASDRERWGDTWRHRTREDQERRVFGRIGDYFDQWAHGNKPMPWLKIACLALIAWVRITHPEVLYNE